MTSARRRIWVACGVTGAAVVALGALLVASPVADPGPGDDDTAAGAPAEAFAVGAPVTLSVGENPRHVVPTPDGSRVLVLVGGGLAVLDAGSTALLGTITISSAFGSSLVLAPGGERAYVGSTDGVTPVDLTTHLIGDPFGGRPDGVTPSIDTISADGSRLFGLDYGTEPELVIIDVTTGTARRIPLPPGAGPDRFVVTPDGSRAYVAVQGSGGTTEPLHVVDLATGRATPVAGTAGTLDAAITPDGRSVHAIGYSAAVVLDAATATVTRTVPTSLLSGDFVVSPGGRYLFVVDVLADGVEVHDMDTGGAVATIAIGEQPGAIALAPDGSALYVTSGAGLTVVPIRGGAA